MENANTKLKKTGLKLVKRWSDITEVFSTCSCPLDGNLSCTDPKDDVNRGFTVIKGKYDNWETFGFYYKHGAYDGVRLPQSSSNHFTTSCSRICYGLFF